MLGLQLVALFREVVETAGGKAYLKEQIPRGRALNTVMQSSGACCYLLPVCCDVSSFSFCTHFPLHDQPMCTELRDFGPNSLKP